MHTKLSSENLEESDHAEDFGVDWKIIKLECILGKQGGKVRTGFICLGIGIGGRLL